MVLTFRKAYDRIRIALKEIKSKNKKQYCTFHQEHYNFSLIILSCPVFFTEFKRRFENKVYKIVIGFLTYFEAPKSSAKNSVER